MRLQLAAVALTLLSLTGCGEEGGDDASGADKPSGSSGATDAEKDSDLPPCAEVWKAGSTLPTAYKGCSDASGDYTTHQGTYCESGQVIYAFGDHHYATPGGPVTETVDELADDPVYAQVLGSCGG